MERSGPGARPPKNMVWIAGGEFAMGSEDFYPEEKPVHTVGVDGFWMDEHPVTVAEFRRFVKATDHVTVAEIAPDARGLPGRGSRAAGAGLARLHPSEPSRQPGGLPGLVVLDAVGAVAASRGAGQHLARPRPAPRHARGVRRRAGVRRLGRQGAADRARVGVRGPRRSRRRRVRLGRRVRPTGADDGQHLAGRLPRAERPARRVRAHLPGRQVPAERLRPGRHDRERLGVDVPGLHHEPRRARRGGGAASAASRARGDVLRSPARARAASPRRPRRPRRCRPRSSRAGPTCARRTTACATGRPPASVRPWTPRPATWASAAIVRRPDAPAPGS